MAHATPQRAKSYEVTGPRASDAIGYALRDAYVRQPLPAEMAALLRKLH